jgi:DNA-binding NtrC family response regulator
LQVESVLILVIDDDHDIRAVLAERLNLAGFRVATAGNGVEGLQAILRERPSLVLLDVHMPLLGGLGLAAELNRRNLAVPIIAMTTDGNADEYARQMGAVASMNKPFDIARLLASVETVLAGAP